MNGVTWTYTYNNAGLRTSRVGTKTDAEGNTTTTDTYEYIYNGSQLVRMIKNGEIVDITYDAAGTPLTMTYDEVTYYYITNLQGDVVGLLDGSGKRMITYRYTAYGQGFIFSDESSMTMTLANMNPLGYRGYVMDIGTYLCYCQSRYYDQTVGRFINADIFVSTGQGFIGNNMFAYCLNNPINQRDSNGNCSTWWIFKLDCMNVTCKSSRLYNPNPKKVAVIYDANANKKGGGFERQGKDLIKSKGYTCIVAGYPVKNGKEFKEAWNSLEGKYDEIYILCHGYPGLIRFGSSDRLYCDKKVAESLWGLDTVECGSVHLYACDGATPNANGYSAAYVFHNLTGGLVYAVAYGSVNYSMAYSVPIAVEGGYWTVTNSKYTTPYDYAEGV